LLVGRDAGEFKEEEVVVDGGPNIEPISCWAEAVSILVVVCAESPKMEPGLKADAEELLPGTLGFSSFEGVKYENETVEELACELVSWFDVSKGEAPRVVEVVVVVVVVVVGPNREPISVVAPVVVVACWSGCGANRAPTAQVEEPEERKEPNGGPKGESDGSGRSADDLGASLLLFSFCEALSFAVSGRGIGKFQSPIDEKTGAAALEAVSASLPFAWSSLLPNCNGGA